MTVYPTEFQGANVYEPVDPPLFLGVEPLLLALVVALVLAAMVFGWWLGRLHNADRSAESAPEKIHEAILKSTQIALAASSRDLPGRAEALRDKVKDLLGPVMVFGKGLTPKFDALETAIAGKAKSTPPAATPAGTTATSSTPNCTCSAKGGAGCVCARANAVSQVTIINGPAPANQTPPPPPPPPPPAGSMTREEQIDALSRAVRAFHDYWSQKDARIREMHEAREALGRHP